MRLLEPGMGAHMMDVLGHQYRCAPKVYNESMPMPAWPGRRPLVSAIPMACMHVELDAQAQASWLENSAAAFCGGLRICDLVEYSDANDSDCGNDGGRREAEGSPVG